MTVARSAVAGGSRPGLRWWRELIDRPLLSLSLVAALIVSPALVLLPLRFLAAGAAAAGYVALVRSRPVVAAYALLVVTPLTAGLARSSLVPLLRPYEVLAVLGVGGLGLRAATHRRRLDRTRWEFSPIDLSIVLLAVLSSVLPMLWLVARGRTPDSDDLLYALVLWKFYALFVVIRTAVTEDHQVRRCLILSMGSGALVAGIAILQSLKFGPVLSVVGTLFPTEDPLGTLGGRGTATLGSSISVADVMTLNLGIALGWLLRRPRRSGWLLAAALLFTCGTLASGQFSGAIGLVVTVAAVAWLTGRVRRVAVASLPAVLMAAVLLRPVIATRLSGFHSSAGLPQSWQVRLSNLQTYYWPELFSHWNYLLGVRPAARIAATQPWQQYVYIESGHTWLLWTGGIPLLLAYLFFTATGLAATSRIAQVRRGSTGVAAVAAFGGLVTVFVLMSFDPHLTMRGTGDLLFSLLALATVGHHRRIGARAPDQLTVERCPAEH